MPLRPVHLLLPLLGVALAFVSPWTPPDIVEVRASRAGGPVGGTPRTHDAVGHWGDARFLRSEMEKACEWAHVATKVAYVQRPTAVPSDAQTVAGFLREDWDAAFRRMGAADDAAVAAMAQAAARHVVAAYDPKGNTVHVLPGAAKAVAEATGNEALASDDVLRLLLVRMAVIALDRQIFTEWKDAVDKAETLDALNAAGAVLQGHAQHITERVAKQWQKDVGFDVAAFDDLVTLLTAERPAAGPFGKRLQAEVSFAVLKGHAFMTAISRKTRPGIARVLKNPPKDRNAIFAPTEYIAGFYAKPPSAAAKLPGEVQATVAAVVWTGDGWNVADRSLGQDDAALLLQPLEKMMYSAVMAGFKSGKIWTVANDGQDDRLVVLEFRKAGLAEAYVNLRSGAIKQAGGVAEQGAGRDSGLPGLHGSETRDDVKRWTQWTSEGRYVVGLSTTMDTSGDAAREPWDDAMEAAAEILAEKQKTRTNRRDKGK